MRRRSLPRAGGRVIRVRSSDGVRLAGLAFPAGPDVPAGHPTFVVAHGFTHSVSRESFARLAGWLTAFGDVRALDSRGHGSSGGGTAAGGDPELADVDAAVRAARVAGAGPVVTVGMSMGGGAVLRQAAVGEHRPDAVVGVSAVSRWYVRDTRPMRRVHWLLETTVGRRLGAALLGLRLDVPWATVPAAPVQLVSAIAPLPLLLVHGDGDEYFPVEHFRTLAQAAGPAATVWLEPGMGHAESGMTAQLAERIGRWAVAAVGGNDTAGRTVPTGTALSATIAG